MASDEPIIRDFNCAICGKRVAYVELYPPGVPRPSERGGDHPSRRLDSQWSYQSNGSREGYGEVTPERYQSLVQSVDAPDAADFVRLRCRDCGLIYCWDHVEMRYEGDPEMELAKLPCGHWRVVDG